MRRSYISASILLAIVACSSGTQLSNMWIEPDYTPHAYSKILAVAYVNGEANRRVVEDVMVKRVSKNVAAVPSYQVYADIGALKGSELRSQLQMAGFDGLLTTRLLGKERETVYQPGYTSVGPVYYRNYWGYWDTWYDSWSSPGYYTHYDVYSLETSFVDLSSDKLVWSGITQSVDPKSLKSAVTGAGDAIMKELKEHRVIQP